MLELQFNHINIRKSDIIGIDLPKSVHNAVPLRESYVTPQVTINNKSINNFVINYRQMIHQSL